MSWNEDDIHRALGRASKPRGLAGSRGHDAAVLRALAGKPVVCVDACVESIHFEPDTKPELVGRKACARALSDLAATAAAPKAVVLAISAPRARTDAWILRAIAGVRAIAREVGADLVGGDLGSTTGPAVLTVTALGDIGSKLRPPGRDRARVGQVVFLTGPCGGSILGRHLAIEPRVKAGRWLHERGATAMMDVSDGLAWDLYRLARASGVRIEIDMQSVPIHADAARLARRTHAHAWEHALHDGEDHELVATLPRSALARVRREARRHVGHGESAAIGRVVRGSGVLLQFADREIVWVPAMEASSMAVERRFLSRSPEATERLAEELGARVAPGTVVALDGELGAGKTCFVRGLARGLGVQSNVASPTYALMAQHEVALTLYHFDAWMERRERAFLADGGAEWFDQDGVCAVEWAARVADALPSPRFEVALGHAGAESRSIRIGVHGESERDGELGRILGALPAIEGLDESV